MTAAPTVAPTAAPVAAPSGRRGTSRAVILTDRLSGVGITAGGLAIILAVIGILVFIVFEAAPLFLPARCRTIASCDAAGDSLMVMGIDEYRERAYAVDRSARLRFFDPRNGAIGEEIVPDGLAGVRVTAAAKSADGERLVLGTADGRIALLRIAFEPVFEAGGARRIVSHVETESLDSLAARDEAIVRVVRAHTEDRDLVVAITGGGRGLVRTESIRRNLLDEEERSVSSQDITSGVFGSVTALASTASGDFFFLGHADGGVARWRVADGAAVPIDRFQATGDVHVAVTSMTVILGDRTLVVGGGDGKLSGWFEARDQVSGVVDRAFRRALAFSPHEGAVVSLAPSTRDRGFLSADAGGHVRLHYPTSQRTLADLSFEPDLRTIAFAPKGDGFLVGSRTGTVVHCELRNRHPEISPRVLFGKVWYEGYDGPSYAWQSSSGSDDFEPKMSLVPLLFGTIKGTLYAMLFAIPIALLAAIYASQFLHHRIRNLLKPTIEIMAALPSVVLGLIAALFLAPALETIVPGTLLGFLILPGLFLASAIAWKMAPPALVHRLPTGMEIFLLIPIALAGIWVAQLLGPVAERILFGGDFRTWLHDTASTGYDQRNCLVVGFAMGFAVIPIIFTICEDSLSAVPQSLVSGSIACGASRWQTALRIVLPAAGSGIFSAIMVGFGRAVGETMIVLMATGNTPVIDWNPFNGMRTLSANIAVEIPEAPYRGTLYRVLFLSGFLLFVTTFLVNSVAEAVRMRLRRKFGSY